MAKRKDIRLLKVGETISISSQLANSLVKGPLGRAAMRKGKEWPCFALKKGRFSVYAAGTFYKVRRDA